MDEVDKPYSGDRDDPEWYEYQKSRFNRIQPLVYTRQVRSVTPEHWWFVGDIPPEEEVRYDGNQGEGPDATHYSVASPFGPGAGSEGEEETGELGDVQWAEEEDGSCGEVTLYVVCHYADYVSPQPFVEHGGSRCWYYDGQRHHQVWKESG